MLIANEEKMKSFQSFSSVTELDQTVRGYFYHYKNSMSLNTQKILNFIWKNSVEVFGVSSCSIKTIANEVGSSERQVNRALNKLIKMKIVKRIPTYRESGARDVNILVIQPFPYKERKNSMAIASKSSLHISIPKQFKTIGELFLPTEQVEKLWQSVLLAYETAEVEKPLEEFTKMVLVALIRSVYKRMVLENGWKLERYFYLVLVEGFLEEKRKKVN
ncbi:winged helix-turn-helix domain-containing protein [Bacillus sp. FJAT-45066]|uniref:winged helix-turn-helix domain-containing protein n=1 Tax=Bacillus sp. FJAT-45066 TaxID=2011010 RepID=UPI000BB6B5B4|nr:winged helix-turn-helix domain-containing protein [Bacillus sp. FJAT-45066]